MPTSGSQDWYLAIFKEGVMGSGLADRSQAKRALGHGQMKKQGLQTPL